MATIGTLKEFVESKQRALKVLPLLHCCDGSTAQANVFAEEMIAEECDVYEEFISYFFYGKSSYVPNENVLPTKIWDYYPVIFVYRSDVDYSIRRIVPLDSGAFEAGLFSNYFHHSVTRSDLEIGTRVDAAARCVKAFFGTNKNYLEECLKTLSPPDCPLIAMNLANLMGTTSTEPFDRRNNTIEVQLDGNIACNGDLIEHIVLPRDFKKLDHVMDRITNHWQVSTSFYRTSRIDPARLAELAAQKALDFVEANYG